MGDAINVPRCLDCHPPSLCVGSTTRVDSGACSRGTSPLVPLAARCWPRLPGPVALVVETSGQGTPLRRPLWAPCSMAWPGSEQTGQGQYNLDGPLQAIAVAGRWPDGRVHVAQVVSGHIASVALGASSVGLLASTSGTSPTVARRFLSTPTSSSSCCRSACQQGRTHRTVPSGCEVRLPFLTCNFYFS